MRVSSVVFFAASMVATVWAAPAPALAADAKDREPYALVISGGVSLGAYEAGLNWGLMALMKFSDRVDKPAVDALWRPRRRPNLAAVTGASAGSINAVLSALAWCSESPETVEDNLFRDTWMALDLAELVPNENQYAGDDALLSRGAMEVPIRRMECALRGLKSNVESGACTGEARPLRRGCTVPIGVMVSRIRPASTDVAGLSVPSQRFVVPLSLTVDSPTAARFTPLRLNAGDPLLGNVMQLPVDENGLVPRETVFRLLKASSAFPLAFGPLRLKYCLPDERADEDQIDGAGCPRDWTLHQSHFVDGGVFDNVPLGVAQSLAEGALTQSGRQLPRVHYLYLDPGRRRAGVVRGGLSTAAHHDAGGAARGENDGAVEGAMGLGPQLSFLGGFIETARSYELQAVLRFGGWNSTLRRVLDRIDDATLKMGSSARSRARATSSVRARRRVDCDALRPLLPAAGRADLTDRCVVPDRGDPIRLTAHLEELSKACMSVGAECPDDVLVEHLQTLTAGYRALDTVLTHAFLYQVASRDDIQALRARVLRGVRVIVERLGDQTLERDMAAMMLDPFAERQLTLSDRLSPLVGSQLAAFGAFLGRPFRHHDYLVGVYDAIYGIARNRCALLSEPRPSPRACMGKAMQEAAAALGANEAPAWHQVAQALAPFDRAQLEGSAADDATWDWAIAERSEPKHLTQKEETEIRDLATVIAALHQHKVACPDGSKTPGCLKDPTFNEFVEKVSGVAVKSDLARKVLAAEEPLGPLIARSIARLVQIEQADAKKAETAWEAKEKAGTAAEQKKAKKLRDEEEDASDLRLTLLGASGFLVTTRYDWSAISQSNDDVVRRGSNGTIPTRANNFWHLIPNRVGVELSRAGGAMAWEPGFRFRNAAVRFGVEFSGRQRPIDDQKRAERDNCRREGDRLEALADPGAAEVRDVCGIKSGELGFALLPEFAFRVDALRPYLGFVGLGIAGEVVAVVPGQSDLYESPKRPPFGFGPLLNLGFFEDKLRITVRKRMWMSDFDGRSLELAFRDGWITLLSFNDLGGLIYWLTR